MAARSKFQISRSLDERIRKFIECKEEVEPEFATVESAFILGFNYANVTNYIGLTTDYKIHNATCPVVGRVYFSSGVPDEQQIKEELKQVWDHFSSEHPYGLGSESTINNDENLFLIYYKDCETEKTEKRIYDYPSGTFLQEQPATTIIDDAKIYSNSAMVKLNAHFNIKVLDSSNKILDKTSVISVIEDIKSSLSTDLMFSMMQSNYSTSMPLEDNNITIEALYSYLHVPAEVQQMGDYLPKITKEEKKKLAAKWRNKVKNQRIPLEFELRHGVHSPHPDEAKLPPQCYKLDLEEYLYLQLSDSFFKSSKYILMLLYQKLDLMKTLLCERTGQHLEEDEVKSCTFKPSQVNHFLPTVYLLPKQSKPDYERLAKCRASLHNSYLIPLDKPIARYSQRVVDANLKTRDEQQGYLCNVHADLTDKSGINGGAKSVIGGTYTYHHYLQDRISDNGWGCAYRSLQTIISWFKHQGYIYSPDIELRAPAAASKGDKTSSLRDQLNVAARVPTHEEIQSVLVDVGDKQANFVGSQKWIGSQEVCYVLNHLYNIESKFISVSSGAELVYKARDLVQHFGQQSTPVMIGGGVLAHTIIGLHFNEKNGDVSYLILDPHYTGAEDLPTITKKGWCGWKKNAFWDKNSFYNLCLPQRPVGF